MMQVYKCINEVQKSICSIGISKTNKNQQQGYTFRGIDDVYNTLSPILANAGLCILPRMTARNIVEKITAKGTVLFYVTVDAEFDLVAAEDGSKHTIKTFGEAMDSGDKATNKAMSAAYKYACMQAFAIPTEGDNDSDKTTHEPIKSASEKTFLSAVEINNFNLAIQSAETIDSLKAEFTKAYKAADSIFDKDAIDKFIAIKDKKLKELQDKK